MELLEPLDFLARVIAHVPQPRLHTVRYLGHYSNLSRGRRLKARDPQLDTTPARDEPDDLTSAERRARRRAWARLLRKVYEISPLTCSKCGAEMKIISFILDPAVIKNSSTTSARRRTPPPGLRQTRRPRSQLHRDPLPSARRLPRPRQRPARRPPPSVSAWAWARG